jgi:hypothetical protein
VAQRGKIAGLYEASVRAPSAKVAAFA